MKETIAKFDWLTAQQCSARAWYGMRAAFTSPYEAERFRMQQGQEVGALARKLYPDGILLAPRNGKTPSEVTRDFIADGTKETFFEATILAAPFVAKADILRRQNGAWHILEVKSSFSETSNFDELVDDLAYTVMVFRRGGLSVARASLMLLSRHYRFGDDPDRLFDIIDTTDAALARGAEFEAAADCLASALFREAAPAPALVSACKDCAFFHDQCLGAGLAHTVFEIPSLHHKKLNRLSAEGIIDLSRVPDDLQLNDRQQRAKNAALSGNTIIDSGLSQALSAISWPCHYLDFETVATVLPLYRGHACHQQVLTQFSIHRRDGIESEPRHTEYLADAAKDSQRELAEALIEALGQQGSIIMYSSFEQTRIKALLAGFPDLAGPLQAILNRLVDLHSFISDYVYHPDFKGSFSIKKVLPALVPGLSYDGLAIRDGNTAITRFARMARGEIVGPDIEPTRRQLLDYCELDTFAMLRLHEALLRMASPRAIVRPQPDSSPIPSLGNAAWSGHDSPARL
jgi:hypothetical protein